jgi:beta-galactosidase/beta-glucuronidase
MALDMSPVRSATRRPSASVAPATRAEQYPSEEFTRGIGIYPGDPREDFSPELVIDSENYRNLALFRPSYHSSSYDYNATAQLVTDGVKDAHMPHCVVTAVNLRGALPKTEREHPLDHSRTTSVELVGANATLDIQLWGWTELPEVDRVQLIVLPPIPDPSALSFAVSVSDDGREWERVGFISAPQPASIEGYPRDFARPGQLFAPSIALSRVCRSRFYQVQCVLANSSAPDLYVTWRVGEVEFYRADKREPIGGPYSFTSAWMSAGVGEEWVYVDLGARCQFDRIKLYWISRAAEGCIQKSDDATSWQTFYTFQQERGAVDDVKLATPVHGRYVRVLMKRATSPAGYILSEMEVYGRGGPVARRKSTSKIGVSQPNGRFELAGTPWRLHRSPGSGEDISKPGFEDRDWLLATVPGTVLTSYLNVGAIPDPNLGKNQLYISDSYFYSDFWYRTEFAAPAFEPGEMTWLHFDGINWKAEVFLNGVKLGRIEGAFTRGRFDVTGNIRPGAKNALAVRIEKNATPGSCKEKTWQQGGPNGGALGADNPTYHASVGWDWIPTIRGRNTGITGSVYLTAGDVVTIEDLGISTTLPLPDISRADVSIELDLLNHRTTPVSGTLRGQFGDVRFENPVSLEAGATAPARKHIRLDPSTTPALRLQNPLLWWPIGYGDPNLYDVALTFETEDRKPSDTKQLKAGIRQLTYNEDGGVLKIWINGRRFIPRGGNWGFSESMLRYRRREYDAALRYHREMNFNMIRNWVGQVGDSEFYQACDRYGVMIWQDFWLANPWDGPDPDDPALFLGNVKDTVLRIRNHPSVALYCGRNEGFPPAAIEHGIRSILADLHPCLHYISNSAEGVVGGGGPYMLLPLTYYPQHAAFPQLHSEIGIPNIPSIESVRATLSPEGAWPPGSEWGLHDLQEASFGRGPSFFRSLENAYGPTDQLEEWVALAHFLDYEGFRAEFEAQSKYRMGLLLWMSHCCWPSLLWQTYDYFLEPTAAYFACKSVCEPLHIQWNRVTNEVEAVNYSAGNVRGLAALAEVLNMDGTAKWKKTSSLDSSEDSTTTCMQIDFPPDLTPVHFVRLSLSQETRVLSSNLYMRGVREGDFRAIRQLTKAEVKTSTEVTRNGDKWHLTTQLRNLSSFPALMVRLKVVRDKAGDRILPVIYRDNYFTLMPGEERTIGTEMNHADTRGEKPRMIVSGFNVKAVTG